MIQNYGVKGLWSIEEEKQSISLKRKGELS